MFRFMTTLFLMILAFFTGRMFAMHEPVEQTCEIQTTAPISYTQLSNAEIVELIKVTQMLPNGFQKITTLAALLQVLRTRGVIS